VSAGTQMRVLLVDDSIDEREMYAEYLRDRGYCTLQAATAYDGFRMAADLAPAVVVTDIKLPGGEDGLALTARLKHDAATRAAAVIVLSAAVFPKDRTAASKAGCDRFLTKPCLPADLEAAMVELVGHRA
jgi:CheY-like chemotaxis protein